MSESLVIAGAIELVGPPGGVASADPRCPGVVFQILPGPGAANQAGSAWDMGSPQPTTDFVGSLLLDGERPQGYRASNRTIVLPIKITAPSSALLSAGREVLMAAVDEQTWTLTWTRDQGADPTTYPLVFDCFRALPSVVYWGGPEGHDLHPVGIITVSFMALPYGRSVTQTQIGFASPVPQAPAPPPAPVVLDAYSMISNPQCVQSTVCIVGPQTCYWDPAGAPANDPQGLATPLTYTALFTTPLNLSGMASLQMWLGLASRYWWNLRDRGGKTVVSLFFTLTDINGVTLSFSRSNLKLPVSDGPGTPRFSRITAGIPQGNPLFNYAAVASYSLTVTNQSTPARCQHVVVYLDALTAYPASQTVTPLTRGSVYTLYGVAGTARAPVSMQFQSAPSPSTVTTVTAAGPGTYTVPANTVYLKVEAYGAGGAGASQTVSGQGGGGGGGEYAAELVFAASAGQVIPYNVGAGGVAGATEIDGLDTVFGPVPGFTQQVVANGANSALQNSAVGGVAGFGSVNSVHFPGANGRTAAGGVAGGGGSSAGSAAPGNSPVGTQNVVFTSGSGNWTCPAGVTQVTVTCIGGGGGGGSGGATNGAGGGGGECAVQTLTVVPATNYPYAVGGGGAGGGSAGDLPGAAGGNTTFSGPSTVTAHGGAGGPSVYSGPGGAGGSGSSNTTHHNGGAGGKSYPYTGGGGSSAGPSATGNTGGSPGGASAPTGGGAGGAGSGPANGVGIAGSAPGGAGGGSYNTSYAGGAGAAGQVTISYVTAGAPTNVGGIPPSGGGSGGAGGASSNTAGSAGTQPGGGGGGANSGGSSEAGGAGAAGKIIITPYETTSFKTLIAHRPRRGCPKMFSPMVSVGAGGDVPNGATFYTMPQVQTGVPALLSGTYTVVLINSSWNSPTVNRTITVTVRQTEYSGGPTYSVSTAGVTVAPGVASVIGPGNQVNNGLLVAGVLTLPVKDLADDNTTATFAVSVTDTNTSDRFYDCLFLDTMGQTVIINEPTAGYFNYYIDEPDPLYDLGHILGSQGNRNQAAGVLDAVQAISGGPFSVEPVDCDNMVFAYSADGLAPSIGVSYYPRFFYDHTQFNLMSS